MNPWIYIQTKLFELLEERRVQKTLYQNERFREHDQALLSAYRGKNPYRICREFLEKRGAALVYAYGETPLSTIHQIVRECAITREDSVIELGAGRGRAALFLAEYVGASVKAYEQIPTFVETLQGRSPRLWAIQKDFFSIERFEGSVIFFYGTMSQKEEIEALSARFPYRSKILTVSFPMKDYSREYKTIKEFTGRFPWGKARIYWNERII